MASHYDVLIIGGGTAGIMTAAQLRRKRKDLRIAIIDPSKDHWYQPACTLVAANAFSMKDTRRDEASAMPPGVGLIRQHASVFEPEANTVRTQEGRAYTYGHLVVAPGIQMNIDDLPGLREALATDKVCSNHIDPEKTRHVMTAFKGGVGEKKTPDAFVKACERFIYVENLDVQEAGAGAAASTSGKERGKRTGSTAKARPAKLSQNAELMRKLRKAFNIAKGEEEEASLSLIGQALRRLDPGFDPRSYGHASRSSLVNALKDQLETRREEKGNTVMVRFRG